MNELEKRKLDLAERKFEADLELRKQELQLKSRSNDTERKSSGSENGFWKSPFGLALVGGSITLISAFLTNYVQGCNNRVLERQKFQSELIQHAIESADDNEAAEINLAFLYESGLIPDYEKIDGLLDNQEFQFPSRQTYGVARAINGMDDRKRVRDPGSYPFSAICRLRISTEAMTYFGTGFFVAPDIVLTAADNISQPGATVEVYAGPETAASGKFSGGYEGIQTLLPTGWAEGQDNAQNFGAIILPAPIDYIQPLVLTTVADESLSLNEVAIAGYPEDRDGGSTLWMSSGFATPFETHGLSYFIDTGFGTAGAPVLVDVENSPRVIGIHHSSGETRAIRITEEVIEQVEQWIADHSG